MFERFTKRARHALTLAHEEAVSFDHNFLGTEHILLGLLRERDGVAARVLTEKGVCYDDVRQSVLARIGPGPEASGARDAAALAAIGIDLDAVRAAVEDAFGEGALHRRRIESRRARPKFARRAKRAVELSLKEAIALGHNYIGTEHLLLALVALGDGVAYVILDELAPPVDGIRDAVIARLEELAPGA